MNWILKIFSMTFTATFNVKNLNLDKFATCFNISIRYLIVQRIQLSCQIVFMSCAYYSCSNTALGEKRHS